MVKDIMKILAFNDTYGYARVQKYGFHHSTLDVV